MKILLIGEYSNVHATLAEGLKALGHKVTVVSNGDFWKNYPRDISLVRTLTPWGSVKYLAKLYSVLPRLRGYDVVQLINPMFLELKAKRIFPIYRYLRKHNGKMFLGGFGMDYYWVHACCTAMPLRYSDFNIGKELRTNPEALKERADWLGTDKEELNKHIADDCDGIISGLYEYWACYQPEFPHKHTFIPYPIHVGTSKESPSGNARASLPSQTDKDCPTPRLPHSPVKVFIGINRERSSYKGTDIMLAAAEQIEREYPEKMTLIKAESVPFEQYQQMMDGSDVILDQLYSYTPSMNSLLAMSKGIVVMGGGEPENYEIIHEKTLRPIINVAPSFDSVYKALLHIVQHPEMIPELKQQSIDYIQKHHDHLKVARQYLDFYTNH
ncbi:MAG: glycosyltransferase family 1 protein [Prevotellaceae bacterium]|nr:glycosyltransferase family 1 protein [Prevotellaceae bacterium]MDY6130932.1 glycosyltransferase family 1 protein [Prevotella sp.]